MIAAIYARKSTDQNVSDDEKSVTRQLERARAYAERKGWIVADEHIYADDGISGAEFVKRPGFLRLMNALEPRPAFQVLIMSEESRLGREQIETAYALKKITDAGIRLFFYLEDRERTLNGALDKVMLSLTNFAAEMEREKARQRTRDAMQRKASRGHVAGDKVYGYRNVRTADHVEREIVPEEAAVIRRIFEEIAAGRGFAKIAKGLNADAIPCPRAEYGHRMWAMTGVREMVFRDLYRGRLVWGRTRWVDRRGTTARADVPEADWIVQDAPELRIVSDELWRVAHARLDRTRQTYLRQTGGKLGGRPELESRNLLSGFLVCGECGGSMHAIKRTSKRGRPRVYYTCNNWRVNSPRQPRTPDRPRGTGCGNSFSAHLGDLDVAVIAMLRNDVLTPDVVEAVVERVAQLYAADPDACAERRQTCASEAQRLQDEAQRLTEAIASGGSLQTLVAALREREQRRADLLAQIEHLDGLAKAPTWGDDVRAEIRRRLEDWRALLAREPEIARQILRKLIDGRLTMTAKVTSDGRFYEITGRATYGRLFEGVVANVVAPARHARSDRHSPGAGAC